MVGQNNLLSKFDSLFTDGRFPRFSILCGSKGSGKKLLAHYIIDNLTDGLYEESGIKIDDIREIICDAYKIHSTAVYFIPDADNMSVAAKNALLKVTEEPPNNAYFLMTLEDENNTLETIRSRATVFHVDRYTPSEILEFAKTLTNDESELEILQCVCETPGEVQTVCRYGTKEFYGYVKLVVDNIAEVSGANSFKIASKVALKDDDSGYDLRLFWKVFVYTILKERVWNGADKETIERTARAILITSESLKFLKRIKGINKQMLIDMWILNIREALM